MASRFRALTRAPLLMGKPASIVAHRGASGAAPENTFPAFELALTAGAPWLEIDVHMSRDGIPVAHHDLQLGRTARGPCSLRGLRICDLSIQELRQCDFGAWFNETFPDRARPEYEGLSIPTLDEVFERYGECFRYLVELKNPDAQPGFEESALCLIDDHRVDVVVQSFSPSSLLRLHSMSPSLPLVQLFYDGEATESIRSRVEFAATYASGIGVFRDCLDVDLANAAREAGLKLLCYTLNAPADLLAAWAAGVDAVITDYPKRAARLLRGPAPRLAPSKLS